MSPSFESGESEFPWEEFESDPEIEVPEEEIEALEEKTEFPEIPKSWRYPSY